MAVVPSARAGDLVLPGTLRTGFGMFGFRVAQDGTLKLNSMGVVLAAASGIGLGCSGRHTGGGGGGGVWLRGFRV